MEIYGWRVGANTINATIAIHKHTSLSLLESKHLIEDALKNKRVYLQDNHLLKDDLTKNGLIIE
jgi:chaperonin GroEL (HSP60 family)